MFFTILQFRVKKQATGIINNFVEISGLYIYIYIYEKKRGKWWCSWLRHCAKSWKVTGLIADSVTGIFH